MNEIEQKAVEEMAKVISSEVKNNSSFPLQGCCYSEYCSLQTATALYAAGYRKQSDTVKEFAEKLIAYPVIDGKYTINNGGVVNGDDFSNAIYEIAASFGVEGK